MAQSKLVYVHDPMCSWCWGYAPSWHKLKAALESKLVVEYKVGGLAPDSQESYATKHAGYATKHLA